MQGGSLGTAAGLGESSCDWPTQLWLGSGVVHLGRSDQSEPPLEPALWLCALAVIWLVAPSNHCLQRATSQHLSII